MILGLAVGTLPPLFMENEVSHDVLWYLAVLLAPVACGAVFGLLLWFLRHVQTKVRSWLGLGLTAIPDDRLGRDLYDLPILKGESSPGQADRCGKCWAGFYCWGCPDFICSPSPAWSKNPSWKWRPFAAPSVPAWRWCLSASHGTSAHFGMTSLVVPL